MVEWGTTARRGRRLAAGLMAVVAGMLILLPSPAAMARSSGKGKAHAVAPAVDEPHAELLMDAASGDVLYERNGRQPWPPASMSKMMVMLLVAERVRDGKMHWDDPIRASRLASKMGGSQVYLRDGEVFPLSEMMQAIIIHSANDATVAVAEAVAGSVGAFVELMNQRAASLGLKDTIYHTPHGLPPEPRQEPNITSALDLAKLARELLKYPEIMKWAGTAEAPFRNGSFKLTNTNHLVQTTNWVDGLKTGYYREAGFNVTATGKRNGMRLIAVVLGVEQKRHCFAEAERLLNQGFAEYQPVFAVHRGDVVASDVPVKAGTQSFVRVVAGADLRVLAGKNEKKRFVLELALSGELQAPLAASAPIGVIIVREDNRQIGEVPALAAEAVERQKSLWDRLF